MKNKYLYILILSIITASIIIFFYTFALFNQKKTIKVGILHSQTGAMAISEIPIINAELLAIEEINNNGGLLGYNIEPIVVDGKSDPKIFEAEAERLITQEQITTIFGCWTSSSRKAVKKIVEKYNTLLFFPVQYEGFETSKNVVYIGTTANQQIIPGIIWLYHNIGKKFFLIGSENSDIIYSKLTHLVIKEVLALFPNAQLVGEIFLTNNAQNISEAIEHIKKSNPDVIINSISGQENNTFFRFLRQADITSEQIPTMSFDISESELENFDIKNMSGDYTVSSYFQQIKRDENNKFIVAYKKKYGFEKVVSDPIESGYIAINLWKKAVETAQSFDINKVLAELKNEVFPAPQGVVYIDQDNNHTWKMVHIGKIRSDKQFNIIWSSSRNIQPSPYPLFKDKDYWDKKISKLNFEQYGINI